MLYHFVSLPSFLYFLFTFNTVYTASHHRVMSLLWWRALAQNVSNLFYHFVSLPSFLYFLFTFNTVYTASHHKVMSLLWWSALAQNVSNLFYHFVSLPSFLYFLFTFNTVFTSGETKSSATLTQLCKLRTWFERTRQNNIIYRLHIKTSISWHHIRFWTMSLATG